MKASEVLRRYAAGERDFRHVNLRGQSFKGQDLSGVDFSNADIRSADFSCANLQEANFTGAKAGLQKRWVLLLVIFSWLLSGISAFLFLYNNGHLIIYIFNFSTSIDRKVTGWVALIVTIILYTIIIHQKIWASPAFLVVIAIFGVIARTGVGVIARTGVTSVVGDQAQSIVGAGAFAGDFAGTATIIEAFVGAVAFAGVATLAGGFAEVFAGTVTLILTVVAGPVVIALVAARATIHSYIAREAMKGNEKYALVRNIAVYFTAIGGTSFRDADLTDANFTSARLKSTDFRKAKLTRTCFHKTKLLDRVRPGTSYLQYPQVRQLILTGQGQDKIFDRLNLRGINLQKAFLTDASFISTDLSEACLQDADLFRAKLVQTQLDATDFTGATLTGAYVEDWGITNETNFRGVRCEYVYMRLPTKENPDPLRKPDNNAEKFADGEFGDFIQPIFDTLDLYHNQGVDPRAIAIAFKELAEKNPSAELEIVAIERRGDDKVLLRAKTATTANKSELSQEYFVNYNQLKALAEKDFQALIAHKENQIRRLENMITTALEHPSFYIETYNNQGDSIMPEGSKKESNFDLKGAQFAGGLVNADTVNAEQIGGDITNYGQEQKQTENNNSAVKTILILASNPKNTSPLRLDEEVREIDTGLQRAKKRELFDLKQRWAVRVQDVYQALLDFKPQIVHFSGHGSGDDGLALEDEDGNLQLVNTEALAKLFKLFSTTIECVVLNACYSEVQAEAIAKYISYVIGMNQAIGDKAAVTFATGFYNALGAGESVEFAHKLGCNVIQLDGIPENLTPVLKKK